MQNIGLDKNIKGPVAPFPTFLFSLISNLSWLWVCSATGPLCVVAPSGEGLHPVLCMCGCCRKDPSSPFLLAERVVPACFWREGLWGSPLAGQGIGLDI